MKSTGIVRQIDNLGRIVIPMEVRRTHNIRTGDPIEIYFCLLYTSVSSTFGKLLAKNNLRHIRFHDLRHTCASLLLANGVPMEQVKEWLGHSEISTTVDIYGHLQYATKKQSAAAIEQDIVAPLLQNLSAVSP